VESDIDVFKKLPQTLLMKMHYEVYQPIITYHPLFDHLSKTCHGFTLELCHNAMTEVAMMPGEELFNFGSEATYMCFVRLGRLAYEVGPLGGEDNEELDSGHWVCEPVLWARWQHRGTLQAVTPCKVANLDAARFQCLALRDAFTLKYLQLYAQLYFRKIIEVRCCAPDQEMWVSFDETQEIAQSAFTHLEWGSDAVRNHSSQKFAKMMQKSATRGLSRLLRETPFAHRPTRYFM